MALDDLNLEFEDEEEVKKKKNDAVQVDVDLEFQNPISGDKSRLPTTSAGAPARPGQVPVKPTVGGPQPRPSVANNVKSINEARPQAGAIKRPAVGGASAQAAPVAGANALQSDVAYDLESQSVVEAREQMRKVEFDAAVKVSVADFKVELLSELNGDMKLLEHQVNQLLVRINAKHPDMKNEVLMIKKLIADFTAKKRS